MILLLALTLSFADSTQLHYANRDVAALQALCREADTREADLLCRYRLYPLTQDPAYVADLPTEFDGGSAQAAALLAGLWGYRAARAPLHRAIRYGLLSDRFLERAAALDPHHPFVLLIRGQSLLFRPGFAGGDRRRALQCFERLRALLQRQQHTGISTTEADLWTWYTLHKLEDPAAARLKQQLLAQPLPAMYRQFLLSPP